MKNRSECPVSFCLDFLGDKWTLLIIRDMIFNEKSTFGEFHSSEEKIATNTLTERLKVLEYEKFIIKHSVSGKARTAYCLTPKGISLIPLVFEMAVWGASQSINDLNKFGSLSREDILSRIKRLTIKLTKKYKLIKGQIELVSELQDS